MHLFFSNELLNKHPSITIRHKYQIFLQFLFCFFSLKFLRKFSFVYPGNMVKISEPFVMLENEFRLKF